MPVGTVGNDGNGGLPFLSEGNLPPALAEGPLVGERQCDPDGAQAGRHSTQGVGQGPWRGGPVLRLLRGVVGDLVESVEQLGGGPFPGLSASQRPDSGREGGG